MGGQMRGVSGEGREAKGRGGGIRRLEVLEGE